MKSIIEFLQHNHIMQEFKLYTYRDQNKANAFLDNRKYWILVESEDDINTAYKLDDFSKQNIESIFDVYRNEVIPRDNILLLTARNHNGEKVIDAWVDNKETFNKEWKFITTILPNQFNVKDFSKKTWKY